MVLKLISATIVCLFIIPACTQEVPTTPPQARAEPTNTPIPEPTNTQVSNANISPGLEFLTLTNKERGISMEVPSSWNREQGTHGLHVRGRHGDFFIRHTQFGAEELTQAADQIVSNDTNFTQEDREDTLFSTVSIGTYGRAYREIVFLINTQSQVSMFTFTANPDFLNEYRPIFNKIKSSIRFTEEDKSLSVIKSNSKNIESDLIFSLFNDGINSIEIQVPNSWTTDTRHYGTHFYGINGDVFTRKVASLLPHNEIKGISLDEVAEKIISINKIYSEKTRERNDNTVVSTGNFGRTYRQLVFFENNSSEVIVLTLSANPDFTDEYSPIFEKIKSSVALIDQVGTPEVFQLVPTPTPIPIPIIIEVPTDFEPISRENASDIVNNILWTGLPIVRTTRGSDSMGFGTDSISVDKRAEIIELYETAYYLLTGDPVPTKFVATLHTDSDYETFETQKGRTPGTSNGFCCIITKTKMEMPINAERPISQVLGTIAHEAAHGRHILLNTVQNFNAISPTVKEAAGISFGAAMVRKIGEYTGIEAINITTEYSTATIFESFWRRWHSHLDDPEKPHDRARILLWVSILKDPSLSHLKYELESNGYLSSQSLLSLSDHFAKLNSEDSISYVTKYLTGDNMADIKPYVKKTMSSKTTTDDSDSLINSNWEAWCVP